MNKLNGLGQRVGLPPVTLNIIIINVILYIATFAFGRVGIDLINLLGLHYYKAESFRIFQPFTYMFMHDTSGFTHILFNMYAVFMFAPMLERVWGGKRFLFYYLFTGLGAAAVQEITWMLKFQEQIAANPYIAEMLNTIGASGAVFGVLLAFGLTFPNIMFIFPFPVKAKYMVLIYGVIELFGGLRNSPLDNVAHFAHLGGMLFGIILILMWRRKYGKEEYL